MAKVIVMVEKKQCGNLVFDYNYEDGISKRAQERRVKKAAEKLLKETGEKYVEWWEDDEYYKQNELTVPYASYIDVTEFCKQ